MTSKKSITYKTRGPVKLPTYSNAPGIYKTWGGKVKIGITTENTARLRAEFAAYPSDNPTYQRTLDASRERQCAERPITPLYPSHIGDRVQRDAEREHRHNMEQQNRERQDAIAHTCVDCGTTEQSWYRSDVGAILCAACLTERYAAHSRAEDVARAARHCAIHPDYLLHTDEQTPYCPECRRLAVNEPSCDVIDCNDRATHTVTIADVEPALQPEPGYACTMHANFGKWPDGTRVTPIENSPQSPQNEAETPSDAPDVQDDLIAMQVDACENFTGWTFTHYGVRCIVVELDATDSWRIDCKTHTFAWGTAALRRRMKRPAAYPRAPLSLAAIHAYSDATIEECLAYSMGAELMAVWNELERRTAPAQKVAA